MRNSFFDRMFTYYVALALAILVVSAVLSWVQVRVESSTLNERASPTYNAE